jgi:hypothetical protein
MWQFINTLINLGHYWTFLVRPHEATLYKQTTNGSGTELYWDLSDTESYRQQKKQDWWPLMNNGISVIFRFAGKCDKKVNFYLVFYRS